MSDALLQVENLKKYFMVPDGMLHAVDDVSFTLDIGETLGVVGESGCGKSTLGKTILQLIRPTSGKIIFDGEDISRVDSKKFVELRPKMQMIFQDPLSSLNPRMSVSQQIAEPLRIHKVCASEDELNKRVLELMDTVGLARRYTDTYPHELDGGRRQRIGIARALALEPKMIICDEPVSALDVSVQAQIINLMMELQEKMKLTYIFISHDMSVIKHISDNIGVMYLGQMIEKASKTETFNNPIHPYTIALLSAIPSTNVYEKKEKIILKGEISSPVNPKPGCRFAARCPFAIDACRESDPPLKEVLPNHFVACHRSQDMMNGELHY
jgi:peptide/nickel transport system ATP-binding protein